MSDFIEDPIVDLSKPTNQPESENEKEFHDANLLTCSICGLEFVNNTDLQQHYVRHIFIKPYKCALCEKSFMSERNLDKHGFKHSGLKPYQCHVCNKRYSKKLKYEIQCRKHGTEHLCESCFVVISLNPTDDLDNLVHHDCDICNQQFLYKPVEENCFGGVSKTLKPYQCESCKNRFICEKNLSHHIKRCTGPKEIFTCNICNEVFYKAVLLHTHERSHIQKKILPESSWLSRCYPCSLCDKELRSQPALFKHYNDDHIGKTKYECQFCKTNFFLRFQLQSHMVACKDKDT